MCLVLGIFITSIGLTTKGETREEENATFKFYSAQISKKTKLPKKYKDLDCVSERLFFCVPLRHVG